MRKMKRGKTILKEAGVVLAMILLPVSTMAVAATEIIHDDFERCIPPMVQFPPVDWTINDRNHNSRTWEYATIHGNGYALCTGGFPDDWLITKQIDAGAYGGDFSFKAIGGWDESIPWFRDTFEVYSSSVYNTPDGFLTSSPLRSYDALNSWTPYHIPLSPGPQWLAIRYTHVSGIALILGIDDVTFPDGTIEDFNLNPGDLGNWTSTVNPLNYVDRWEANYSSSSLYPPSPDPQSGAVVIRYNSGMFTAGSAMLSWKSTIPPINLHPHLGYLLKFHRSITFWMYHDTASPVSGDSVSVYSNITCPLLPSFRWIPLETAPNSGVLAHYMRYSNTPGWVLHTIILPWYYCLFKVRIGFLGTATGGGNIYIDDVVVNAY